MTSTYALRKKLYHMMNVNQSFNGLKGLLTKLATRNVLTVVLFLVFK